eukprot:4211156-Pleurochrysis_carterae.AAC.1
MTTSSGSSYLRCVQRRVHTSRSLAFASAAAAMFRSSTLCAFCHDSAHYERAGLEHRVWRQSCRPALAGTSVALVLRHQLT